MTLTLNYPAAGRGSFATNAHLGGTLNARGTGPGPYYRAPASLNARMPGLIGALAVRHGLACDINSYAVYKAVAALQSVFGANPDGILGKDSHAAICSWQKTRGLYVDGVIGPKSCRAIYMPLIVEAVMHADPFHFDVLRGIVVGTISVESAFDLGAVGVSTPKDLGIAQINGPAHPTMSADARLDPDIAITWMVGFVEGNLRALEFDVPAAILAYNLGRTGARYWVQAGRPQWFRGVDTSAYIRKIQEAGII